MAKRLLFKGNGNDLEKHLKECKVKDCEVCEMGRETLQRWKEEVEEDGK